MGRLQMFYVGWDDGDAGFLCRYFKMAKAELAVECKALGVSTDGTKAEMRRRIVLRTKEMRREKEKVHDASEILLVIFSKA